MLRLRRMPPLRLTPLLRPLTRLLLRPLTRLLLRLTALLRPLRLKALLRQKLRPLRLKLRPLRLKRLRLRRLTKLVGHKPLDVNENAVCYCRPHFFVRVPFLFRA